MLKRVIAVMCAVATVIGSAVGLSNNKTEPETTFTAPAIEIAYYDNTYYLPYALSYNEWEEIYCVVMSEAEGEGFDGQMFVANCIINKCRLTGKTPHDVTKKGYSHRCNYYSDSVKKAVDAVFDGGQRPWGDFVTVFYAPKYGRSAYHESQIYYCTVGNHKGFIETQYADLAREAGDIL